MPRQPALLLSVLLASVHVTSPLLAEELDAEEAIEREIHVVERGELALRATIAGHLEARHIRKLRLITDAYAGPFHVAEILATGGTVQEGQNILRFDPTRLDEALDSASRQLEDQQFRRQVASADLEAMLIDYRQRHERAKIALERAKSDLEVWRSFQGPRMLKAAELSVRQSENNVRNQQEELAQLEEMYEDTEIATETKEIVLDRARRGLAIAREWLALIRNDEHVTRTVTHPNRSEDVDNEVRFRTESLDSLEISGDAAIRRKKHEIASLDHSITETSRRVMQLKADRERLTLRAPIGGIMSRIDLHPDDAVSARQVIAEISDPGELVLRIEINAADLRVLQEGDRIPLRLSAFPEVRLVGVIEDIDILGRASGEETTFNALIAVEGEDPLLRLGLRVSGQKSVTLADRIIVPRDAVTRRDGRHLVTVEVDGETREREIVTGASNEAWYDVVEGLAVGDRIVLDSKK